MSKKVKDNSGIFRRLYRWNPEAGKMVELYQAPKERVSPEFMIDNLSEPIQSMADGKYYGSKAALRASYKAHGLEEVGNEHPDTWVAKPKRSSEKECHEAVEQAYHMCKNGMAPLSEFDRELCRIQNEQIRNGNDARNRPFDRID